MNKISKISSEIRNFFSEKRKDSIMDAFTKLLESLHLDNLCFGDEKASNCQLTNLQVFQIIVLMPFFAISGISHYPSSVFNRMFGGKKDILYSFMQKDDINWRSIVQKIAKKLILSVTVREDYKKKQSSVCADWR